MTNTGIQISSVRAHLETSEDILDSFRKVSKMGYKHIQIQWINPEIPIEFIHDALQETGLNCIGTLDYYDLVVEHLDEIIEANHLWGGTYVTVSGIPERYQTYEGCLEYTAELNKLSIYLVSKGLILNFHPRSKDGIMDSSDKKVLVPVGQGSISCESIFNATKETGIQYAFAEQETSQGDPFDCLEESYK